MIALIAVVWVVAMVAMSAGGVRAARHRAQAAADLAALAAASHARDGSARACGVAATVARAAHARLINCALRARVAAIKVVVATHVIGFGSVHITAIARAGPVRRPEARGRSHRDEAQIVGSGAVRVGGGQRSIHRRATGGGPTPFRSGSRRIRDGPHPGCSRRTPTIHHGRHLRAVAALSFSRFKVSGGQTRHPEGGGASAGRAERTAARSERDRIVHMGAESSFRMLGL
jgi:secretion/DNA translocation related TadE-like protein